MIDINELLVCVTRGKRRMIILFVRRSLMKFYQTVRLTAGAGQTYMQSGFYRRKLLLKNIWEHVRTHGNIRIYIYEGVVEPFLHKKTH